MNAALKACLFVCFAVLFATCQKDFSVDSGNGNIPNVIPSTNITASVAGRVIDQNGEPVKGVLVTAGLMTATTDVNGSFSINNANVLDQAAFVKAEKTGFFTGSRTFVARQNQDHYVEIQLLTKTVIGTVSATSGGTINVANGSAITLPANGIVVESTGAAYTGNVQVSMAWIDPTSVNLFRQMPGDLRGIDEAGRENNLQSFGMLAVELNGSGGEKLQIASGKKASLKFPLPSAIQAAAPATIPLWSFNETTGLWKQEGSATKSGNVYLADVSHFSFWNCDAAFLNVNFSATFKDQNGNPLVNRLIKITRSGPANGILLTTYAYTDNAGYVAGRVPQNESMVLEVLGTYTCTQAIYSQNLGPYAPNSNANLGVVTVNTGMNVNYTLTGMVNNCAGSPVTNGFVRVVTGNGVYNAQINNGTFNLNFASCSATQSITYYAVDNTASQQSNTVTATINSGTTNLTVINACGTNSNEFINVTFNGATYQLLDSLSGNAWTFQVPMTNIFGTNISQNLYVSINSMGQAQGTFTIDNMDLRIGNNQYYNSATVGNVVYTEYGAPNQFIAGTVNQLLRDSLGTTTYPFNCTFRVRRHQ